MRSGEQAEIRLVGMAATSLLSAAILARAGSLLPPPPWGAPPADWSRWLDQVGPAAALMGGLRVLALAAAVYLTAAVTLHVVAHLLRWRPLIAFSRVTTIGPIRRLIRSVAGVGLAASVSAGGVMP